MARAAATRNHLPASLQSDSFPPGSRTGPAEFLTQSACGWGGSRSRVAWAVSGLGSPLRAVIRLPTITSLSVGPNTQARERRSTARVAGLVVDAAETPAASVARSERFELTVGGDVIMVGSRRWLGAALSGLSLITGTGVVGGTVAALSPDPIAGSPSVQDEPSGAQEPAATAVKAAPGTTQPAEAPGQKPDVASVFSQPGDDPPRPFVPLHPSTVDDRQQTEAM